MNGRTITVTAEWALYGNAVGQEGDRVRAWSSGRVSRDYFRQATGRFLLGGLEDPPEVSVSYLNFGRRYLSLAIHDYGQAGESDGTARRIETTRYFCVPYPELARASAGYLAMYDAFRDIRLPAPAGEPCQVAITVPRLLTPAVDPLAVRVAALLLTGQAVCVLGGRSASVTERLAFIDTVMALLPYGMRATMAAATWTRAVYKDHKFRLFFSSAPRPGRAKDHVVTWGEQARAVVPEEFESAAGYLGWLAETVGEPAARLASLTRPATFGTGPATDVPRLAGVPDRFLAGGVPDSPFLATDLTEEILLDCVAQLGAPDQATLTDDIVTLRVHAARGRIGAENRARYRRIVAEHRLLSPGLPLGQAADMFHDMLLRLAFGTPLDYVTYCQLEDCLGQEPQAGPRPHPSLVTAICRAAQAAPGSGTPDVRVAVLMACHLEGPERDAWLGAELADAAWLIAVLAEDWCRPHHARLALDVVTSRLRAMRESGDRRGWQAVRKALRAHGHLAAAYESRYPDSRHDQIDALTQLLGAVYPEDLDEPTVREILAPDARTHALLTVVLSKTRDSALMTWVGELIAGLARQQDGGLTA